jgi:protein-L-isoaspartate(D-aspartate) O-methyltransferase
MDAHQRRRERFQANLKRIGVHDARVIQALEETPRIAFIPPAARSEVDLDAPLSIGFGQTISQPSLVALMTQDLELEPRHRVLEIGTGSGFQTAILAKLAREVFTVEIVAELSARAESVLKRLGISNVHFKIGDGHEGWPEYAPFDRILVAASARAIPEKLIDQLNLGGRMIIPRDAEDGQELVRVIKTESGPATEFLMGVRFVPLV